MEGRGELQGGGGVVAVAPQAGGMLQGGNEVVAVH